MLRLTFKRTMKIICAEKLLHTLLKIRTRSKQIQILASCMRPLICKAFYKFQAARHLLYSMRKLCIYNFTFYQQRKTSDAYCFTWQEAEEKSEAIEIGTYIYEYLKSSPTLSKMSLCGLTSEVDRIEISTLQLYSHSL